ncbi:hypothetical protein PR202_gb25467 [Eleusine coracana subsp. coracana]|uniref:Uncharacterized protein n=1 Tax=Eleusine coracana subsp. coracana TaxID=191504 RepID=A0AAV5FPC0_ELECO|nr:hypothetical protein PR202_gb25467 [Eleusine coracana subsp. coracana]
MSTAASWTSSSSHWLPMGCYAHELRAGTRRDWVRPCGIRLPHARTHRRPLVDVAGMPPPSLAKARLRARWSGMRGTTEAPLDGAARDLGRTHAPARGAAMASAPRGCAASSPPSVVPSTQANFSSGNPSIHFSGCRACRRVEGEQGVMPAHARWLWPLAARRRPEQRRGVRRREGRRD